MFDKPSVSSESATRLPVVLMPMGAQERKGHDYQVMTVKYMRPLIEHAACVPLLAPTCFGTDAVEHYLSMVDGVYLTGAGTNIDPASYGQVNLTPEKEQDRGRDCFDQAVLRGALARGLPLFCVCRGLQELNVLLGGTLHQKLYTVAGMLDHREDYEASVEQQYAQAHEVSLVPGTWFHTLMQQDSIGVNSLHGQGIDQLGRGIEPLGHASDGLVEVVHLPEHPQFSLGVQWHPEWQAASNPFSVRMFQSFGAACARQRLARFAAFEQRGQNRPRSTA